MKGLRGSLPLAVVIAMGALLLGACRTTRSPKTMPTQIPPPKVHRVQKGENAYRIALRYGVPLPLLVQRNRMTDATKLSEGQLLIIPECISSTITEPVEEPLADLRAPRTSGSAQPTKKTNSEKAAGKTSAKAATKTPPKSARKSSAKPSTGSSPQNLAKGGSTTGAKPSIVPTIEPVLDCKAYRPIDERPDDGRLMWPVDGVVVSKFGQSEGIRHEGIDIAAPVGTPIRAAATGRVIYSGLQGGYGHIIIVRHDKDRVTIYAHNAKNCVLEGTSVSAGDVLALVGQTGGANSPVLHFEVREGLKSLNPRRFLP